MYRPRYGTILCLYILYLDKAVLSQLQQKSPSSTLRDGCGDEKYTPIEIQSIRGAQYDSVCHQVQCMTNLLNQKRKPLGSSSEIILHNARKIYEWWTQEQHWCL